MKITILFIAALSCLPFVTRAQQQKDSLPLIHRPADIGLVYPISTNGRSAGRYSNNISLQAIAGVSGAINGCAVAGIANLTRESTNGAVFAGITNMTGRNLNGAQFAGLLNSVKQAAHGIQAAGLINTAGGMKGVQIAGMENITHGNGTGTQVAGLINRSADAGTQIAGLLNMARKVKGVQISGLINMADSSDYPIGFINIIRNGEKNIRVSANETGTILASFRSGGRVMYGLIGAGGNLKSRHGLYALEAGIGAHLLAAGRRFRIDGEAAQLVLTDLKHGHCFNYSLRLLPEVKITNRVALFAGPSVNLALDYSHKSISGLVRHYVWTSTGPGGHFIGSYLGAAGGVTFIL